MTAYGSVCSGIEAASVAWEPIGMAPVWFSEIEEFPSRVLRHHWPAVPNLGDMLALPALIRSGLVPAPPVLVGGTPCQAFSVAGARKGLDDDRGQLTMTYVEILNEIDKQRPGDEATLHCIPNHNRRPESPASGGAGTNGTANTGSAGPTLVVCLDPKEQSHGGPWTPNTSEWPNDAAVSSLWQVLETGSTPQRYFLSAKAAAGILRRAEARGKTLPEPLRLALEKAIAATDPTC